MGIIIETLNDFNSISALFRLCIALIMGAVLGLERSTRRRAAGMRTYMLVSVGACSVMMTGLYIFKIYGPGFDPARLAAQVISGVGFIGAGTIITTSSKKIKGLTTAAGLWTSACLGIASGAGFYIIACGGFLILLATLSYAEVFEKNFNRKQKRMYVSVVIESLQTLKTMRTALASEQMSMVDLEFNNNIDNEGIALTMIIKMENYIPHNEVIDKILSIDGVDFVEEA